MSFYNRNGILAYRFRRGSVVEAMRSPGLTPNTVAIRSRVLRETWAVALVQSRLMVEKWTPATLASSDWLISACSRSSLRRKVAVMDSNMPMAQVLA